MDKLTVTLQLPASILTTLGVPESELGRTLCELIAVALYREGRISLGKVAEIVGVLLAEVPDLLARHGLHLPYTADDALADWQALREGHKP